MGGRHRSPRRRQDADLEGLEDAARRQAGERHAAYHDGNLAALYDVLFEATRESARTHTAADTDLVLVPRWAVRGANERLLKTMNAPTTGKKGPGASWRDRYRRDCQDYGWYEISQAFRHAGLKGKALLDAVQEVFRDTGRLAGTPAAMRNAIVERVPRTLANAPGRYYRSHYLRDTSLPLASATKAKVQELLDRLNATVRQTRKRSAANRVVGAHRAVAVRQLGK